MTTVLVTGGAGYIGSHACAALVAAGYSVVALDNFSNSSPFIFERLAQLAGPIPWIQGDIRDRALLDRLFSTHTIDAVMHFAGLKAVGESLSKALEYYDNNVNGTLTLLSAMAQAGVRRLVFSSSATVYGDAVTLPIREEQPRLPAHPYGRSKLMVEDILEDLHHADETWRIARLRYFNPVGAHPSGLIGEAPKGIPNNLMPYIAQVAMGLRDHLKVFGGDYPTCDGTGVRDYIHVMDLVRGHILALQQAHGLLTLNLGTGHGTSVLQMIRAFEQASQRPIPYQIVARRSGDVAECYADSSRAQQLLGWKATQTLAHMCEDSWRWQQNQPRPLNLA